MVRGTKKSLYFEYAMFSLGIVSLPILFLFGRKSTFSTQRPTLIFKAYKVNKIIVLKLKSIDSILVDVFTVYI